LTANDQHATIHESLIEPRAGLRVDRSGQVNSIDLGARVISETCDGNIDYLLSPDISSSGEQVWICTISRKMKKYRLPRLICNLSSFIMDPA
jgi:hypothetical protein